jgi:hypothetical protein
MSGLRGSSWWIAAGAGTALVVCVAASILHYFGADDPEAVFSPGPPPIAGVAAASPSPPSAPSVPAKDVDPDQTTPFHDFAMVGEKFAPEWLVRVERVYFADDGRLMAEAKMPNNPRERRRTIEAICLELSDYVTGLHRKWSGVSVRTIAGAELHTKDAPDGSCTPE